MSAIEKGGSQVRCEFVKAEGVVLEAQGGSQKAHGPELLV